MPDFRRRRREAELMDEPGLDPRDHRDALTALRRANLVSFTAATLWPAVRRAASAGAGAPIRLLDIASGGGDVAVALGRRAARAGLPLEIVGLDTSALAVEFARTLAARAGVTRARFEQADALDGRWPDSIDIATCTLFLHHLEERDAVRLLARMKDAARRMVLVSDLRRSRTGVVFTWVGCRLLSRSRVFRIDGARSVAGAFTPEEARGLAARAGLAGSSVSTHWPQRWVLTWRRDAA